MFVDTVVKERKEGVKDSKRKVWTLRIGFGNISRLIGVKHGLVTFHLLLLFYYIILYILCVFLFKIIFGFDFLWWVPSGEVYTSLVLFIVLNKYENFQREKIMIVFISLSLFVCVKQLHK